jgi:transposase
MKEQIRVLLSQGLSIRKVALALGVSRQTVRKFGAESPGGVETPDSPAMAPEWHSAIDWPSAGSEIAKGATIKQLHQELAPEVTYASFRRRLLSSVPRPIQATVRLEHKPGEQAQIDYCDGIAIVDRATGEVKKTHLFCGVLPFSSYAFGEFAWSQKLPSSSRRTSACGPSSVVSLPTSSSTI